MSVKMNRRELVLGGAALMALAAAPRARAADKTKLRFSAVFSDQDIRAKMAAMFGEAISGDFDFEPYYGGTLFKQGTELTAMQRGNLDMANLAVYDFYNQAPETSILGTAYLYRDYAHMRKVNASGALNDLWASVEQKTKVKVIANPYIGTRHVNIKGDRKVMTPADLAGVKLRMPGGEGWQFVGKALGANPTPMAFTEVYTALQTGAIDGQDNPLPADKAMKFYEVTNQIILTGHLIAANQFAISSAKWNSMTPAQQKKLQACATNFEKKLDEITLKQEAELVDFFKQHGLKVYEPDKKAFRDHVLKEYQNSKFSKDWPKGLLERVNAL